MVPSLRTQYPTFLQSAKDILLEKYNAFQQPFEDVVVSTDTRPYITQAPIPMFTLDQSGMPHLQYGFLFTLCLDVLGLFPTAQIWCSQYRHKGRSTRATAEEQIQVFIDI